ncbi:condensin-2 complex subunit h2 [Anaeramoeba ignava]|uniref:Condensin-2 complex subunit h2 n=1 Tax=Anaeramoeba ignava TaxID=1746090 RepID=A0A9Q0R4K1_ANAIG|nr:condensin-2 complex subunit h2 [Anaeramoeba ignava]
MEDFDNREKKYSHLLKPIRGLAENWNIDIAKELEEYLTELESIKFTFDGGKTHLNFAEAALLIQGSACVYSKKVEYLYNLLYQTLDLLTEKRKNQKSKNLSNKEDGDEDMNLENEEEEQFLVLDDNLKIDKNIDLEDSFDINQILGISDRTTNRTRNKTKITENKIKLLSRTPIYLLGSTENQQSKANIEYYMTNCLIHPTGTLLLDERDLLTFGSELNSLTNQKINRSFLQTPKNKTAFKDLQNKEEQKQNEDNKTQEEKNKEKNEESESDEADLLDDDSDEDEVKTDQEKPKENIIETVAKNISTNILSTLRKPRSETKRDKDIDMDGKTRKGLFMKGSKQLDPWILLDPYDSSDLNPKPFAKGQTFRVPKLSEYYQIKKSQQTKGITCFGIHQEIEIPKNRKDLKNLYFPEFEALFQKERQNILSHFKKQKKKLGKEITLTDEKHDEMETALVGDLIMDNSDFSENDVEYPDQDDEDMNIDLGSEPDDFEPPKFAHEIEPIALDDDVHVKTYEDLCRDHIENFLSNAAIYVQETDLTRRVADWQSKITPLLEEQNSRSNFDIHEYGNLILDKFESNLNGNGWKKESIDSHSIFTGLPKFDICRHFLSLLQLVNNENVQISQENQGFDFSSYDPVLENDNSFQVKILTKQFAFEKISNSDPQNDLFVLHDEKSKKGRTRRGTGKRKKMK